MSIHMRSVLMASLVVVLGACGSSGDSDSGVDLRDASVSVDAGGSFDSGVVTDAGVPDAGEVDAGPAADAGLPDAGEDVDAGFDAGVPDAGPLTFTASTRTLNSGTSRTYVLATPSWASASHPVTIVLHGDGGNGAGIRTAFALEAASREAMLFVYPNAPNGTFEYWTDSGRAAEVTFVTNLLNALDTEFGIDRSRVFIVGFSGGATMANALGCRMGSTVVRGLGIHSGTLYAVNSSEFTYTNTGGVSCALPATLFIWGQSDNTEGVSYADGRGVRDNYTATQMCSSASTPVSPPPCVTYGACTKPVVWCGIAGMGHAIWPSAGKTFDDFFFSLR